MSIAKWAFAFLFIFGAGSLPVVAATGKAEAKPRIFCYETNPWLMVIGSDSPVFALYDDGTAIFQRRQQKAAPQYFSVKLAEAQKEAIINCTADAVAGAKQHYAISMATDQPSKAIWIDDGTNQKRVSVYGVIPKAAGIFGAEIFGAEIFSSTSPAGGRRKALGDPSLLPPALLAAFRRVFNFDDKNAQPWLPPNIEVMLWPFEDSNVKPIDWPEGWPDTKDPHIIERHDQSYSIFLPSAKFGELKALMAKLDSKTAIRMNGRKWAISYRYPFPGERTVSGLK